MGKHDFTKEDVAEYQDYFLYEKVLTDWFEYNPNSRYSSDRLGKVKILEEK